MSAISNNISRFCHSMMVTILVLTLGLSANVNGRGFHQNFLRRRQLINNHDGPALDRRLHERGTDTRHSRNAAMSSHSPQQMDRLTVLIDFLMRKNHNSVAGFTRGKREQCTTSMDELVSKYRTFHDVLSPFLHEYPSHLKPAYQNSALNYVTAILDLLPKDSSYISSGNVYEVKDGINKTLEMTQYVLQRGENFIVEASQSWFQAQASLTSLRMGILYLSIGCVVTDSQTVQEEASGIGGGNTSKKGGPSARTLELVRNVAVFLTQN